ncbi:hypothetical protein U6A24_19785 [Aquimarina gracilis]|uniref:RDD family protein n=1 Tax=Aquimarina gracilis TaxID=874422 RepID=A0ABU6A0T2_9FLAO|nr:hypothetical protein [Aquimarina gracilis]MEB3347729.1 hypothetical protein [Aquimarina gracilis]
MNFFSVSNYEIKLENSKDAVLSELNKLTKSSEQYISNWNNQTFIGKVNDNGFEIVLSKKILGQLCVFRGKFQNINGILEIKVNKVFRLIFLIFFIFPIAGFAMALVKNGISKITELILPTISTLFVLRFIFLEFGFRVFSKIGINKLLKIEGIGKIGIIKTR